jgi:Xaa-Pro dipeptidase
MNRERIERTKAAMKEQRIDALVCRLPENVLLLSGYWPLCGWVYLLFPLESVPVCILPNTEESEAAAELWDAECMMYPFGTVDAGDQYGYIENALRKVSRGRGWKRVGYEGNFENTAPAWNAAELYVPALRSANLLRSVFGEKILVDATGLLELQRSRKTAYEIDRLRTVNEIAGIGLEAFREAVRPGISGVELAARVESEIMVRGTGYGSARRVRAFAQVAVGPDETSIGYRPMEITTSRTLGDSEIALLELAVVADGYWSDRTRAAVAGSPTERIQEVYEIVCQAQRAAIESVRPGARAGDVDEAARRVIRDAGLGEHFMHITGHGVGFGYHESVPRIAPGSAELLREGMVHSVEPGIYFPEMGGLRVEDDVLVTGDGVEVLGPFSRDLAGTADN